MNLREDAGAGRVALVVAVAVGLVLLVGWLLAAVDAEGIVVARIREGEVSLTVAGLAVLFVLAVIASG